MRSPLDYLKPEVWRTPEGCLIILSAAMPIFGIYTVLAQKHHLEGAASLAMLGATTGAFVTLNILLFVLT